MRRWSLTRQQVSGNINLYILYAINVSKVIVYNLDVFVFEEEELCLLGNESTGEKVQSSSHLQKHRQ